MSVAPFSKAGAKVQQVFQSTKCFLKYFLIVFLMS